MHHSSMPPIVRTQRLSHAIGSAKWLVRSVGASIPLTNRCPWADCRCSFGRRGATPARVDEPDEPSAYGHREPRERRGRQMPAPARRQGSGRAIRETPYSPTAGQGGSLAGIGCPASTAVKAAVRQSYASVSVRLTQSPMPSATTDAGEPSALRAGRARYIGTAGVQQAVAGALLSATSASGADAEC
jgi:hypothetical protein